MDSFLSNREQLGRDPKSKKPPQLLSPGALEKLKKGKGEEPEQEVAEEHGHAGSKLQYVSEDGRVVKIVVTCSCGQVTEIDCTYDD